jgi:hypothetical protein
VVSKVAQERLVRAGGKGAPADHSRAANSLFHFPLFPGTRRRYLGIPGPSTISGLRNEKNYGYFTAGIARLSGGGPPDSARMGRNGRAFRTRNSRLRGYRPARAMGAVTAGRYRAGPRRRGGLGAVPPPAPGLARATFTLASLAGPRLTGPRRGASGLRTSRAGGRRG